MKKRSSALVVCMVLSFALACLLPVSVRAQGFADDNLAEDDLTGDLTTSDSQPSQQEQFDQAFRDGQELQSKGQFAEAIAKYQEALSLLPNYAPAHFETGRCFAALGADNQAIGSLSQAVIYAGMVPGLAPAVYLERGKLYLNRGRYQDALDDFQQTVDLSPSLPESWFFHGKTLLRLAVTSGLGGAFDTAAQANLIQAVGSLERAIALKPDFGDAYLERGRALARMRELDFAVEDLERAVSLLAAETGAPADLGYALSERASAEAAKPEPEVAQIVTDYRKAIASLDRYLAVADLNMIPKPWESRDPIDVRPEAALVSRASASTQLANELVADEREAHYRSAVADCDRMLAMKVGQADIARAHLQKGIALRLLNDLPGAIDAFTMAAQTVPGYTEAHLRRGIAWFHQGELEMAISDFESAIGFQSDPRAFFWMGIAYAKQGDHLQAVRSYSRAVRYPGYTLAHLNRGLSYLNLGRYDRAIEDFDQVLLRQRQNTLATQFRKLAVARRDVESTTAQAVTGP